MIQNGAKPGTIYGAFAAAAAGNYRRIALKYRARGRFVGVTYGDLKKAVDAVATNLRKRGIGKGDGVAILSANRPEWAIADLAALKLGAFVVPIYVTLPTSAVKYILDDSRAKLVFVENAGLISPIRRLQKESAFLKTVVVFDAPVPGGGDDFVTFDELKTPPARGDDAVAVGGPGSDDAATVVYTSGTTGEPKGVVLTHANIVSNAAAVIERFRVTARDKIVSYLPLSHMFERTCGYYVMLFAGGSIAYAEDLTTVARDVAAVKPTVLIAVPRVLEKAYGQVVTQVEGGAPFRKRLVVNATKDLNTYANLKYGGKRVPWGFALKCALYNKFIAARFRKIAGGKLRLVASGGAPLDKKLAKGYYIMGFNIVEGYGLTETSPVVCVHTQEDIRLGTVGKPLAGVKVKIGADGEVLVNGPGVMKGYLNKPRETACAFDDEGWFHTGDRGRFDADGNLTITGRIKELIVTAYGENVAPAPIEARLTKSPYCDQVVVYGDRRPYLVAGIVPDKKRLERFAAENGVPCAEYASVLKTGAIRDLFAREVARATADLPSYERVKSFFLIPEPFTVENGLLTPTLKSRREKIAEKYEAELTAAYAEPERNAR